MGVLILVAGFLFWGGWTLILDAWVRHRRRRDLSERLVPYRSITIGDEAEEWLRRQHH